MRHLCLKVAKTGFLPHLDRLMILYVFGHMGDEGKAFVHQVMKFTVNYKFQVTQTFINRLKEKTISCMKLRDTYQKLSAEIGCNCVFSRSGGCYPSPVLHALRESTEESIENITLPVSKTLTKESSEAVFDELNTAQKVKDIAQKILALKKQKRSLGKSIGKLEQQLARIYDDAHVESLECDFGVLTRRKKSDGSYEWLIEL